MIDGIIVVRRWSDTVREGLIWDADRIYAVRKFDNKKTYDNIMKSLHKQVRKYGSFKSLTFTEFKELFAVEVYRFDKIGWPVYKGELSWYLA